MFVVAVVTAPPPPEANRPAGGHYKAFRWKRAADRAACLSVAAFAAIDSPARRTPAASGEPPTSASPRRSRASEASKRRRQERSSRLSRSRAAIVCRPDRPAGLSPQRQVDGRSAKRIWKCAALYQTSRLTNNKEPRRRSCAAPRTRTRPRPLTWAKHSGRASAGARTKAPPRRYCVSLCSELGRRAH